MEFKDRVVLVTGGASGIGRAIVEAFAQTGAKVAFSYMHSAEEAATLERSTGATAIQADLTKPEGAGDLVAQVKDRNGPVEILIANSGGLIQRSSIVDCSLELWNECLALNMTSTFLSAKAVLPDMLAASTGVIVTISSLAAHNGGGMHAAHYGAAKGGVYTFTKALAREVGPLGIRVNGVAPGLIGTRFHDRFNTREGRRIMVEQTPLRREGTPEDVAGSVLFLCSRQASFLAGEPIEINGGLGLF